VSGSGQRARHAIAPRCWPVGIGAAEGAREHAGKLPPHLLWVLGAKSVRLFSKNPVFSRSAAWRMLCGSGAGTMRVTHH
jgi:hypothetical protein